MRSPKRRALEAAMQGSADSRQVTCESCGQAPATATYRIRDQYEKRLCENCGMTYRSSFGDDLQEV